MTEETIGARLSRARIVRGETIQQVATATHSSPASFSAWENDHSLPSDRSLLKLPNYYGVDFKSSESLLDAAGESTATTSIRTCLKSGQFDMIVQKRMITYELPQQSLTAPI